MSRRANPTAIGLFLIGAIVLALIGIGIFVSAEIFDKRAEFVSYFRESVNGLDVGAPVKFKGVPVGQVTELLIRIDQAEETFQVPVLYEIDLNRLKSETGELVDLTDEDILRSELLDGLRAKLQMESIITGKLYVELTYIYEPGIPHIVEGQLPYPQIPTIPSLLATLQEEAGGLVEGLQTFDVSAINQNLMLLLVTANEKLDALEVSEINENLIRASAAIEDLARAPEIREALRKIPEVSEQLNLTLAEAQLLFQRLDTTLSPLPSHLEETGAEVNLTLQALREAISNSQQLLSTDYGIGYRLEETLSNLSEAAEALRQLATSIERNPSLLLRGRTQPDR